MRQSWKQDGLPTKEKGAIARPFSHVKEANGLPGFPVSPGESDRDQFS